MTDSEVYNASMTYHAKVAKKGCAADKVYWVGELRALRAAVNYQIIMNHDNKGEDPEELKVARERLRFGLSKALEYVK